MNRKTNSKYADDLIAENQNFDKKFQSVHNIENRWHKSKLLELTWVIPR